MFTILYIEDDEDNRVLLTRSLKRRGYQIETAEDGQAGVAMCQRLKPDLVLMDLGLPVISGWDATKILKEDPATAAIPIIALSAYAMKGDREKALEAGCDDYDSKPVDMDRLMSKIQGFLPDNS